MDAGLGQKEAAIAEGQRAVKLMPLSRDAYDGMLVLQGLAQVYTWTGETEKALELVRQLMSIPGYLTYGYLKVDPSWDPLRERSALQTICRLARARLTVKKVELRPTTARLAGYTHYITDSDPRLTAAPTARLPATRGREAHSDPQQTHAFAGAGKRFRQERCDIRLTTALAPPAPPWCG